MERDLDFWKDCYRDALREIVRTQGLDALMAAPRIATVCRSLADASERAYLESVNRCGTCNGEGYLYQGDVGNPCHECNGTRVTPAKPKEVAA
jgi:hypothetical protein